MNNLSHCVYLKQDLSFESCHLYKKLSLFLFLLGFFFVRRQEMVSKYCENRAFDWLSGVAVLQQQKP